MVIPFKPRSSSISKNCDTEIPKAAQIFSIEATEKAITFNVTGYGHGVGMSQYGADFMARQGSTYEEILKHYYEGVEIK